MDQHDIDKVIDGMLVNLDQAIRSGRLVGNERECLRDGLKLLSELPFNTADAIATKEV